MSTSDYITLRLKGPLLSKLGAVLEIKVSTYEEKKKDIVERLIQQYPLIGYTRPLRYRQFLQTVANVMTGRHGPGRDYLPYVYRDVVLLAAYSGEVEFACRELEKFYADLRQRNDYNMRIIGTLEQWRTDIERALEQSKLKERVASEISKFDLLEFQDFGFEFDEEVSLFEVIQRASQG